MTRELTAAELQQRREARTKSGAYSGAHVVPFSEVLYRRLRRAVNRSAGRTTAAERRQLRYLALYESRIQLATSWLATRDHELFEDVASGKVHPLVDRVDGWIERASRIVSRMPERILKVVDSATWRLR